MIPSIYALAAAAIYGAADFLGGTVAKRASTLAAVVATQGAGLVLLLLGTPLMLDAVVTPTLIERFGAAAVARLREERSAAGVPAEAY